MKSFASVETVASPPVVYGNNGEGWLNRINFFHQPDGTIGGELVLISSDPRAIYQPTIDAVADQLEASAQDYVQTHKNWHSTPSFTLGYNCDSFISDNSGSGFTMIFKADSVNTVLDIVKAVPTLVGATPNLQRDLSFSAPRTDELMR